MADLLSEELVNGNARADIGGAFFHAHAGEESAVGAGMIAGTIGAGVGIFVVKAAENLDVLAGGFEWREGVVEFEILFVTFGPPGSGYGAIGKINEGGADGRAGGGGGEGGSAGLGGEEARWC